LIDALIGATAAEHRMTLVTLNIVDLGGLGLSLCPLPDDLV
jgi:predicted nucleic acid-binding protein